MKKYFDILKISPDASLREIKKSARVLFLKFHPDINPHNRVFCEEKTKGITEAYRAILKFKQAEKERLLSSESFKEPGGEPAGEALRTDTECLAFVISHRLLAINTIHVRGILRLKDIIIEDFNFVSEVAPFIVGLFYHGKQVGVLWNLHDQLHFKSRLIDSSYMRNKLVIVEYDDSPVGFIVDEVKGIANVENASIRKPPQDSDIDFELLEGIAPIFDEDAFLIDLEKILYTY